MLQGCVNWLTLVSGSCGKSLLKLLTLCGTFNWPLYSNTVIGTLAVDGWAVTFWYSNKGPGRAAAPFSPFLAVPNVTSHPSTANVAYQLHIIWCGTIIACDSTGLKIPDWLMGWLAVAGKTHIVTRWCARHRLTAPAARSLDLGSTASSDAVLSSSLIRQLQTFVYEYDNCSRGALLVVALRLQR